VHLLKLNNYAKGSFQLLCSKRSFCIFEVPKMKKVGFFCEAGTKNMAQNATTPIFKQSTPYLADNAKVL